ncbi:MAG: hypothetical protein WCO56_25190 [Verrucomicrobiota bacterium]
MAMSRRFICGNCGKTIEPWDDGNPYYITASGEKKYAYHPNDDLVSKCIGNDSPHLCLGCGHEFMVDSRAPIQACPKCSAKDIADTWELDGRQCPFCQAGKFAMDPDHFAIS